MFDFEITGLWIITQIFSLIGLVLMTYAFQVKSKRKTLIIISISCMLGVISSALLGNWALASILAVTVIRNTTFAWIDGKQIKKSTSVTILVFFLIATVLSVIFIVQWWLDWLLLVAALFSTYGKWAKGIHLIRVTSLIYSALAIIIHIYFTNFMAVLIDVFIIVSIVVFYIRYFRQQQALKEAAN